MSSLKDAIAKAIIIAPITEPFLATCKGTYVSKANVWIKFVSHLRYEHLDYTKDYTIGQLHSLLDFLCTDPRIVISTGQAETGETQGSLPQWVQLFTRELESVLKGTQIEIDNDLEEGTGEVISGDARTNDNESQYAQSGCPTNCVYLGCTYDAEVQFRFCAEHLMNAYERLTIPRTQHWVDKWDDHLEELEIAGNDGVGELWIIGCGFFAFKHCLQVPHHIAIYKYPTLEQVLCTKVGYQDVEFDEMIGVYNSVSPEQLHGTAQAAQVKALRSTYGRQGTASGTTFHEMQSIMLQKGLCSTTRFVSFRTPANVLVARKLIAGINEPFVAQEKSKDALMYFGRFQPFNVHALARRMLKGLQTEDSYTIGGLHAALFGAVDAGGHSASRDAVKLFDVMRVLGTYRAWMRDTK